MEPFPTGQSPVRTEGTDISGMAVENYISETFFAAIPV
jgi:hypothetical protein